MLFEFDITGCADFPGEMLKRNRFWGATATDREQIRHTLGSGAHGTHSMTLRSRENPDEEEWLKLGWTIKQVRRV